MKVKATISYHSTIGLFVDNLKGIKSGQETLTKMIESQLMFNYDGLPTIADYSDFTGLNLSLSFNINEFN